MNQGKYVEKILLSLGLVLLFSSTSMRYINEFKFLTYYSFYFGGLLILIVALSSLIKKDMFMNNSFKIFTFMYGGFISLVIVSTFVNQSLEVEIDALEQLSLAFLFLGISLALTDVISEKVVINSLMISSSIIFVYFLIEYPLSEQASGAYRGGFTNPNRLGMLAVTFFSVSLVAGTSLLKAKRNYFLALLYLVIAIGVGNLTMISNSRTSFVSLIIVFGIISITFTYDVLKSRNLLSWKSVLIIILFAFGGLSLLVLIDNPIYTALESSVLDKFTRKIEAGSLTAGRAEGWMSILSDTSWFGTANYFAEHSWAHAHNSFLEIIVYFGWFTGIAYILFWVAMLIKSIQYYLTEKLINVYAILPLVVITNFLLLSMMELVQFHVATFLAISMVAIFSKQSKQKKGPSMFSYMHNRYRRMDRIHSR